MPTHHERALLAEDTVFKGRVRQSLEQYCVYLATPPNPTPPDNELRHLKEVIAHPNIYAQLYAYGVAQSPFTGGGTSSDPLPDTTAGDTAMDGIIQGTLWPMFVQEVAP